jgi:hypothetical protein
MYTIYDVLVRGIVLYPMGLYWIFGKKLIPIDLGGKNEMGVKFNSMSNILHEVMDTLMVLPCWPSLATHDFRGWGY